MPSDYPKRPQRLVAVIKKLYNNPNGLTTKELASLAHISERMAVKDFNVLREV